MKAFHDNQEHGQTVIELDDLVIFFNGNIMDVARRSDVHTINDTLYLDDDADWIGSIQIAK